MGNDRPQQPPPVTITPGVSEHASPALDAPASAPTPYSPPPAGDASIGDDVVSVSRVQFDQLLDSVLDMQSEIASLKSAQSGESAVVVDQADHTARFDAELEALSEEFADYPAIGAFEQRALVGLDANLDIRLKNDLPISEDPIGDRCRWKLRWFNFSKEGRSQQAAAEGYMKVAWDDLADPESIAQGARLDTWVRRGDRGNEVLHKIPRKLWDYKKRRDAARREGLLTSTSGLRDRLANAVASRAGAAGGNADQAGSFVKGKAFELTIKPGKTERFTP